MLGRFYWIIAAIYVACAALRLARFNTLNQHGLDYDLPLAEIIARLAGRRICPHCHAVFHEISQPPRCAGKCDACGATLQPREDDRPEVCQARMREYTRITEPLINYYRRRGRLITVSAAGSIQEIFQRTIGALAAWTAAREA